MDLAVCQICKYPVWSYICPHCLAKEIAAWLPSRLSSDFRKFSRSFLGHFASFESNRTRVRCIRCRRMEEATVCSFCYISEVFSWLQERNRKLARTLFMALPLDASSRISGTGSMSTQQITPISYDEKGMEEGNGDGERKMGL
jgi:hypothetical protein